MFNSKFNRYIPGVCRLQERKNIQEKVEKGLWYIPGYEQVPSCKAGLREWWNDQAHILMTKVSLLKSY